jgi:hypothetical protein
MLVSGLGHPMKQKRESKRMIRQQSAWIIRESSAAASARSWISRGRQLRSSWTKRSPFLTASNWLSFKEIESDRPAKSSGAVAGH